MMAVWFVAFSVCRLILCITSIAAIHPGWRSPPLPIDAGRPSSPSLRCRCVTLPWRRRRRFAVTPPPVRRLRRSPAVTVYLLRWWACLCDPLVPLSSFCPSIETLGHLSPGDTDTQELPLSVRHEPEEGEDLLILQLGPWTDGVMG
jgi:hypothetical protein